jgi:hypothetical protein
MACAPQPAVSHAQRARDAERDEGHRWFLLVGLVPIDVFAFRAALQLVRRTVFIHETERLPIVLASAPSRCSRLRACIFADIYKRSLHRSRSASA